MHFQLSFAVLCFAVNNVTPDEGIVVSGGYGPDHNLASTSVEVFVPSTGQSCSLPPLPEKRAEHTMDNLSICGGFLTHTSCLEFSWGQWTPSYTTVEERRLHTSWWTDQGLVLMGGFFSQDTTEIVPTTGDEGGPSFAMKYDTMSACAIPDTSSGSVVMTGGIRMEKVVTRYNLQGFVEELPQLIEGRYSHGCGSYTASDGSQVLMVAGGWRGNSYYFFSSTEILTAGSTAWTLGTPLPMAVYGLKGVTLGTTLYMTGGKDYLDHHQEVLEWSDNNQEWVERGMLQMARAFHSVSTVQLEGEVMDYCV